jgi:hypothetical protein
MFIGVVLREYFFWYIRQCAVASQKFCFYKSDHLLLAIKQKKQPKNTKPLPNMDSFNNAHMEKPDTPPDSPHKF